MAAEHGSKPRILLVGHTGAGKSSSGNTILGLKADQAFKAECCPNAVTKVCEKRQGKVEDRDVLVVDTPGLNDAEMTGEKLKSEIGKCFEMCAPGPHALLLVIRLSRFTEEQQAAVKWIPENFGKEALKYTIVLFTGKDDLDGKSVEKFVSENTCLQQVVHDCGGRYHAFNNRGGSLRQVTELFSTIENMLQINNADYYKKVMYECTQDNNAQREKDRKENEEKVKEEYVKNIKIKEWENLKKQKEEHEKNFKSDLLENLKTKAEEQKHKTRVWQASGAAFLGSIGGAAGAVYSGPGAVGWAKVGAKVGGTVTGIAVGVVTGCATGTLVAQYCDRLLDEINDNSTKKDKTD